MVLEPSSYQWRIQGWINQLDNLISRNYVRRLDEEDENNNNNNNNETMKANNAKLYSFTAKYNDCSANNIDELG